MNKKAEPIKNRKDIEKIEQYLKLHNKRDYVIWVLGMNSGLRVSDIVGLNVSDVVNKTHITIVEKKTQKLKSFYINDKLKRVLKDFTKGKNLEEPLFLGKQGKRLDRSQVYRFIVRACKENGITAHVSTHTMRKSFGYHHYQKFKDPIVLQKIFNHSSQRITLMYIGVEQDEIDFSYKNFEL
ncbi:TPA: tyrosine-type recombinase/integrase [Candidatus Galligastranaerophilus intestinavium]|uniref:Tyrosine-type recombinase/integrase n=1 Tax=Candidatus Galligastranaerophilus intestinavium TaxID=2840836 RepID=A0A9D1FJG0_9BACT|nr:tyrosine-type recombinase/integrase [Candidatus Galligastranaerophilus intestinavium]